MHLQQAFAIKSGNWSDATIWSYQMVPDDAECTVYSAGQTVVIDVDARAELITTDGPLLYQPGGIFVLNDGVTFTGNVLAQSKTCLEFSGNTCTIVGDISGGNNYQGGGVKNLSTGTMNVVGNVRGGDAGDSYGLVNASTGTVNVTGSVAFGGGAYSWGVWNNLNGDVVINEIASNKQGGYVS